MDRNLRALGFAVLVSVVSSQEVKSKVRRRFYCYHPSPNTTICWCKKQWELRTGFLSRLSSVVSSCARSNLVSRRHFYNYHHSSKHHHLPVINNGRVTPTRTGFCCACRCSSSCKVKLNVRRRFFYYYHRTPQTSPSVRRKEWTSETRTGFWCAGCQFCPVPRRKFKVQTSFLLLPLYPQTSYLVIKNGEWPLRALGFVVLVVSSVQL